MESGHDIWKARRPNLIRSLLQMREEYRRTRQASEVSRKRLPREMRSNETRGKSVWQVLYVALYAGEWTRIPDTRGSNMDYEAEYQRYRDKGLTAFGQRRL